MITDEERREVAANIRSAAERAKDDLNDDSNYSKLAVLYVVSCGVRGAPHYKDLLHLADLIDRPTCRIILARELRTAYGKPITGINGYILSCGHQAVGFEKPRYCPECGMEVGE